MIRNIKVVEIYTYPLYIGFLGVYLALNGILSISIPNISNYAVFLQFSFFLVISLSDWHRRATYVELNTLNLHRELNIVIELFIIFATFLFLAIFWTCFHTSLFPVEIDANWPPFSIFLKITSLLVSELVIIYSPHYLIQVNKNGALWKIIDFSCTMTKNILTFLGYIFWCIYPIFFLSAYIDITNTVSIIFIVILYLVTIIIYLISNFW